MRTKTLLLSAAALAAGLVSSVAQSNVYSANVVGYINLSLTNGFNLVSAGQLGNDVSGTNNTLDTVFGTNLPLNATVFAWSPASGTFNNASWVNAKGTLKFSGQIAQVNAALELGQGVFIQSPANATVTVVGNVVQGTNAVGLPAGFNLVSSAAPLSGGIQAVLNYVPALNDSVIIWDPSIQGYSTPFNYVNAKGTLKWSPSEPQIQAGQAVFIQTTGNTWTNKFIVQ